MWKSYCSHGTLLCVCIVAMVLSCDVHVSQSSPNLCTTTHPVAQSAKYLLESTPHQTGWDPSVIAELKCQHVPKSLYVSKGSDPYGLPKEEDSTLH